MNGGTVRFGVFEFTPVSGVLLRDNAAALRNPFARTDVQEIATTLGAQWVVIGQLKADGSTFRVVGHLIRAGDMKHVWAHTYDQGAFDLPAQQRTGEAIATAVSQTLASN